MWKIFIVIAELFGALASKDGRHSLAVTFKMALAERFKMFGIKNWKTSAAGIAALLSAIAAVLHSYSASQPIDWNSFAMGCYLFYIGIFAKDANVTGGTVPQTLEAIVRVDTPEVIMGIHTEDAPVGHNLHPTPPQRPTL
jgi:hypothetical protein